MSFTKRNQQNIGMCSMTRRASLGRSVGTTRLFRTDSQPKLFRMNSLSKLAFHRNGDNSWATDSKSSFHSRDSNVSQNELENDAMELLQDLNKGIEKLFEQKDILEKKMNSSLELAIARHIHGSSNIGPILSMRKMTCAKSQKAQTAAARFRLIEIRQRLKAELDRIRSQDTDYKFYLDLYDMRQTMQETVEQLQFFRHATPSDDELLAQLERLTQK